INPSAVEMLRLSREHLHGVSMSELLNGNDRETFERIIARAKRIGHATEQVKLNIGSNGHNGLGEMTVSLTATALPDDRGAVLVFEDLSELIAAQRSSAWQEVARRMAHEIKNPLTPIQLSAERIAKRVLSTPRAIATGVLPRVRTFDSSSDAESQVIRDGTDTIIREVQSLKAMVDEFSQFARLPDVELAIGNINNVIEQAAALYLDRGDVVRLETQIDPNLPDTKLDVEQLKRVFVNLIDNAIEAPSDADAKIVSITSRHETARDIVVIEIADNGKGIEPSEYQKLFQPYFSTKGRGTGLGLAIVHRIITEHHGKIKAAPNQPNGAKFIIELPVSA
ncbi:MAG: sensor histidine kinase, partial [Pyrinomonadaceae bacterium]